MVSIEAATHEVQESDQFVSVVVTKTGNLQQPVHGLLTTLAGSANGKSLSTKISTI